MIDFAALQMQTQMQFSTVKSTRKQLNQIVKYYKEQPDYREYVRRFAEIVRSNISVETFVKADSFFVNPDIDDSILPMDLRHDALGFSKSTYCVFSGRFVYPVKDVEGDVMGWCGYDAFEQPKYLDSKNYGYVAKRYSVYGMEEMPVYYNNDKPVFFVEGIVCCLYLRQCGLQSLAYLGSHLTPYVLEITRRFGSRAIVVADSDESGNSLRKQIRYNCPKAITRQSLIAKDVDDSKDVNPDVYRDLSNIDNMFTTNKWFR